MIYAMSDIHGQYELMEKRIEQLKPLLSDGSSKLILLGDYIDRGNKSYECLKLAYDLEQEFGKDKIIVLKGNHEVWFEEFLFMNEDVWLAEDKDFFTSGTFLTAEQFRELDFLPNREARIEYVKKCIKENQKELISWMRNLRLYYETDTQIFVHAGVDEDIPEEEIQWCTLGTPDYVMTGKYPPSIGHFYKDTICRMEEVLEKMKKLDEEQFDQVFVYDNQMHGLLVEMTGMTRLYKAWKELNYGNIVTGFSLSTDKKRVVERQYPIHKELVDACREKNKEKICHVLSEHYMRTIRRLLKEQGLSEEDSGFSFDFLV